MLVTELGLTPIAIFELFAARFFSIRQPFFDLARNPKVRGIYEFSNSFVKIFCSDIMHIMPNQQVFLPIQYYGDFWQRLVSQSACIFSPKSFCKMSQLAHRIYITTLASIVALTFLFLLYKGVPYYSTPIEERFYHPDHNWFKPSGAFGHGLGIVGTLLIIIGVFGYMAKKKYKFLARFGRLKYWLEFHIFLCSLGPVMILFHTAFKFGGIVSISFWSMVAVVASGVIGRFIYVQIPRTIEGRELSLNEVKGLKANLGELLKGSYRLNDDSYQLVLAAVDVNRQKFGANVVSSMFNKYLEDKKTLKQVKTTLRENGLASPDVRKVTKLVDNELSLNNRIERLATMQKLFKYWHVAHLPFALIMLIIMVIHVGVTLAFGYRWIF